MGMILPLLIYGGIGIWLSRVLTSSPDEVSHLALGWQWWLGHSLYGPDMTAHRMPLGYLVLGLTQLDGPTIWVGRLVTLLCGGVALIATTGASGSSLTAWLMASSGVLVGYYALATPAALAAAFGAVAVLALMREQHGWLAGSLVAMFYTRVTLWPIAGVALIWLAWQAWPWALAAILSMALFFFDPNHWRVLAASNLGYAPLPTPGLWPNLYEAAQVIGRYLPWVLAVPLLCFVPWRRYWFVGLLGAVGLVTHLILWHRHLRLVGAYLPEIAPFLLVPLGVALSRAWPRGLRYRLLTVALLLLGVLVIRHPAKSSDDVITRFNREAAQAQQIAPAGTRALAFGRVEVAYLAGWQVPVQQLMGGVGTLAPANQDASQIGGYGISEIRRWLDESRVAVIPTRWEWEARRPEAAAAIRTGLENFIPILSIQDAQIWRRRP
jgi:hypothetical protein